MIRLIGMAGYLLLLTLMVLPPCVQAHDNRTAENKVIHAVRAPDGISIDGRLDDAAWAYASPIRDFTQREPIQDEDLSRLQAVGRDKISVAHDKSLRLVLWCFKDVGIMGLDYGTGDWTFWDAHPLDKDGSLSIYIDGSFYLGTVEVRSTLVIVDRQQTEGGVGSISNYILADYLTIGELVAAMDANSRTTVTVVGDANASPATLVETPAQSCLGAGNAVTLETMFFSLRLGPICTRGVHNDLPQELFLLRQDIVTGIALLSMVGDEDSAQDDGENFVASWTGPKLDLRQPSRRKRFDWLTANFALGASANVSLYVLVDGQVAQQVPVATLLCDQSKLRVENLKLRLGFRAMSVQPVFRLAAGVKSRLQGYAINGKQVGRR